MRNRDKLIKKVSRLDQRISVARKVAWDSDVLLSAPLLKALSISFINQPPQSVHKIGMKAVVHNHVIVPRLNKAMFH